MCGLFGFNGKQKPIIAKLKILGIYNISRGKDSCGYWFNGTYERSKAYNEQEFDDYIEKNIIKNPTKTTNGYTFIGHTRQGSAGFGKTLDNAHPFIIDESFVLAHNGTIQNYEDLLKKYDINEKFSVDSKAFGTLINRIGYSILEEYIGYAALLMTDINDPGTIAVYHGESKQYRAGQPVEERPLYFLETKEGVYFSSLKESLMAIRENEDEEPKNLVYNKVVFFEKGIYNSERTINIDRLENNIAAKVGNTCSTTWPEHATHYHGATHQTPVRTLPPSTNSSVGTTVTNIQLTKNKIWYENVSTFNDHHDRRIYFQRGRYYDSLTSELAEGFYEIERSKIVNYIENVPDDTVLNNENSNVFYFIRGVMIEKRFIKTLIGSIETMKNIVMDYHSKNFAILISKFSVLPVALLEDEYTTIDEKNQIRYLFWKNGVMYSSNHFSPKFSNRHYHVDARGYLFKITSQVNPGETVFMTQNEYNIFINNKNVKKTEGGIIIPNQSETEQFTTGTEIDTYSEESKNFHVGNSALYKSLFAKYTNDEKVKSGLSILYSNLFKVYDTEEKIASELPDTIIKAVELTVKEQMFETSSQINLDLVRKEANRMIEACVIRKTNLYTLFNQLSNSPEYYIYQAYKQEELESLPVSDMDAFSSDFIETEEIDENEDTIQIEGYIEDIIVNDMESFYTSAQLLCGESDDDHIQELAKAMYESMDNLKKKASEILKKGNFSNSLIKQLEKLNSNKE